MRIRLFGRAGDQGAEVRGLPGHPGELEPRHDHDRSGAGGRNLHRADHAGDGRHHHREGKARRAAADHGWPDGAQLRAEAGADGRAQGARRRDDRRQGRSDREGRRPQEIPRGDGQDRPRKPALGHRRLARTEQRQRQDHLRPQGWLCRSRAPDGNRRPALHRAPGLHARRPRRRRRLQPPGIRGHRHPRPADVAGRRRS